MAELLVSRGAVLEPESPEIDSLISSSIYGNSLEALHWLFGKNVDIDKQNTRGSTPLSVAISLNKNEFISELLQAGASIAWVTEYNWESWEKYEPKIFELMSRSRSS